MVITRFWRLLLSHLAILLLSTLAGVYSIIELGSLSGKARTALDSNHRLIGYQEALTDTFLSQVRYGGKYIITHTEGRHEQFHQFKKDFMDYLSLLKILGEAEPIKTSLLRIERLHRQYHDLFEREVQYIRAHQTYAQSRYEQEREKIVESSISELDRLKAQLRTDLHERLEGIEQGARTARSIAIVTTLIVLFLGTLFSFKVSRGINSPLTEPRPEANAVGLQSIDARLGIDNPLAQTLKAWRARAAEWLQSLAWLQSKGLATGALTLLAAWNRRSTIWRNPTTPKGN